MKKLKVAAYCRVSTDKDDQVNSFNSQMKYFTDYISGHDNWQMCEVYCDEGISGTSIKKRAGFNRMISDAYEQKMDLILTKEVSRFARNTVDTLSYTRRLKDLNVGVYFMNDNIDTRDSDGELRLSIMASIAQEESRKTSERVKWGQKRRMEQGVVFGRDMLGYTVHGGQLFLNEAEADTVRLIFHKYLIEGKGTRVIARELREAGIKPKRVNEWTNTTILRILRNEKYVGDLCQKKTYTPDYLSHAKKYNNGNEEMVYLKDHHDPIIDRETWEATQKELARRSPSDEQKSKYSNRYWCSGKVVCGECGQRFVSHTKHLKNGEIYKSWRCYAAARHGLKKTDEWGNTIGCDSPSINDRVLLLAVQKALQEIRQGKDSVIKEMMQEIKAVKKQDVKVDSTALYEKIDALNDKKRRAVDLVLDGTISKEDLKAQNQYYENEIASLSAQIADAENSNSLYQQQIEKIEAYISEINRVIYADFEDEQFYRDIVERIIINGGGFITVYLTCVPYGMKFHYTAHGKLDKFTVDFDSIEVVE